MLRILPKRAFQGLITVPMGPSHSYIPALTHRSFTSTTTLQNQNQNQNAPPDLRNIEIRWPNMKEHDQADVVEFLEERMEGDWKGLTLPEKRALYYIYFGNWGPRSGTQQKSTSQLVLGGLSAGIVMISLGIAIYNYALDLEREEKIDVVGKRLEEELKKRQEEELLKAQSLASKKWWKLW